MLPVGMFVIVGRGFKSCRTLLDLIGDQDEPIRRVRDVAAGGRLIRCRFRWVQTIDVVTELLAEAEGVRCPPITYTGKGK